MPTYLTGACVDYRFAARPLPERRALVRQLVLDVAEETRATLLERLIASSHDAPSLPIDVAFRQADDDDDGSLLVVSAGTVSEIADGAARAARLDELWAATTEDLLPKGLLEERVAVRLPTSVYAELEAHRERGAIISALLAKRWAEVMPRLEKLDARTFGEALAPFVLEPRTSFVAVLSPWDKLDLVEHAARLGVDVSALLCFAFVTSD